VTPIVVGIADCQTSKDRNATLIAYALGSCVGVGVFDPANSVAGLLHILLPESSLDAEKAARNPCMFADTGVVQLLNRCQELGAAKSRLRVWLAGGSSVMDARGVFNIGKRKSARGEKSIVESRAVDAQRRSGGRWVAHGAPGTGDGNVLDSRRRRRSGIESGRFVRQRSMTWPFRS
jgi:chemotaxis protein CheD